MLIFVQLTQYNFFIYVTMTLSYVTMINFNLIPYFEPKRFTINNVYYTVKICNQDIVSLPNSIQATFWSKNRLQLV